MRKDYKQICSFLNMNKRGQIAIFVIIAVAIVLVIVAGFFLTRVDVSTSGELNPNSFLRECIEPKVLEGLEILSRQGGSLQPENYLMYEGDRLEYLCYTSTDYDLCVVQQPLLVRHVENELKNFVGPTANDCVRSLKEAYEDRGFEVSSSNGEINVSIISGKINVEFLSPMTVTKEQTQTFSKFGIAVNSEFYDLLITATSIIQYESSVGNSETLLYIQYYPDLKIEKIKRDGDTVYKLSNVVTGDKFNFASRSLVFPAGYGLS